MSALHHIILQNTLQKLLSALMKREYTLYNTQDFSHFIKAKKMPSNHQLVLFNVVSLFANAPIDTSMNIIAGCSYKNKEIKTRITKIEVKEIKLVCAKGFSTCLVVKFIPK